MTGIAFRCPDVAQPSGGVRLIFRHARIVAARVFAPATRGLSRWLEAGSELIVEEVPADSILVLPETDAAGLEAPGRKVVLAQSAAFAASSPRGSHWRDREVEAVIAVSEHVRRAVRDHFDMDATVIPPSVDPRLFKPRPKRRALAFMPRRNGSGIERILARAKLDGFELMPIDRRPLAEVAELLGEAAIFLAAGPSEGFGLPALEAMACGCRVAGYAGGGGLDYMKDGFNCFLAEDGDEEAAAEALGRAAKSFPDEKLMQNGLLTARRFSQEREREAVLRFWTRILGVIPSSVRSIRTENGEIPSPELSRRMNETGGTDVE